MEWLLKRLESFDRRAACIEAGHVWTYRDLLGSVRNAQQNLGAERIVPIESAHTFDSLSRLLALAATDKIALPLAADIPGSERSEMRRVAADSPLHAKLKGSGLVLFSSGSSGKPKAMLHSLPALLDRYKNVPLRNDRTLQLLLIDHIGGLDAALRCLCAGSTLVVPAARDPDAAGEAIAKHKVNILPASPTFLNLMLLQGIPERYDCQSLEIIAYGAEPMPQTLLHRLGSAFPNLRLQQKFGTSETGAIRIESHDNGSLFFRIKDPDTEWKVIEDELWLKTPSLILGYINAEDATLEADGWYRSGDLVEQDDAGRLRIIGRRSDMINVGGRKVHPAEVEAVISQIKAVDSCRVYAEPDPIAGQRIACDLYSNSPMDLRGWKRTIRSHCLKELAAWKIPSKIRLPEALSFTSRLKQKRSETRSGDETS